MSRTPRFATWSQATGPCAKAAQPGARALMAAILAAFPGAVSWGILSCRSTALGNPSAHGKGRALDVGCSLAVGRHIVRALLAADPIKLGISNIIHDGRSYSKRYPHGHPYNGHPHRDHVHIEMTGKGAKRLTLATARRVLRGVLLS